jgi:hypothetical protein
MTPTPVTAPEHDFGRRAQSAYDLEKTLVAFIKRIVGDYALDNPTLNLAQAPKAEPKDVTGPDEPPVSYEYTRRARTLALKVTPQVVRGRVPRTVTGEIVLDRLPSFPSVIVQAVAFRVENTETIATVRIFVCMYDENPDSGGYQDCLNVTEAIAIALTSYGQAGIDEAYPIVMPFEWKLIEPDTFPHYITEMITHWELPGGRPLPDATDVTDVFPIVPAEQPEFLVEESPLTEPQ